MSAFLLEWLNLLIRWAHLVVGIGWIGTSFYFIALDLGLRKREGMPEASTAPPGRFTAAALPRQKYLVAPATLRRPDLVQVGAYLTWVTGFGLLVVQYYVNARAS
jgi:uncharacterized membrane protein